MPSNIGKDRVKPNLVRAWFDTVLNPLIWGLRTEVDLVERGNFTWRCHSRRFASLAPVRSLVAAEAWDNLDQFLALYPNIKHLMDRHDQKLDELHARVSAFFDDLIGQPAFISALRKRGIEGAGTVPDPLADYAAEYLANSIAHLPDYYSTAEFWNAHSGEFFELRERDPELVVRYGITDASVVWLAQREHATLLTDDKELYGALPSDPQFSIVLTEHCL